MVQPLKDLGPLDATLDARLHGDAPENSTDERPRELVLGSSPQLSSQIHRLLQHRLRAASLVLSVGFGLYLLRAMFVSYHVAVLVTQTLLTIALTVSFVVLARSPQLSKSLLRWLEIGLFGAAAAFFGIAEFFAIQLAVETGDGIMLVAAVKSAVMYVFGLIVLYGMLIPNRWQRALLVVVPIALVPFLVATTAIVAIPGFRELAGATSTGYLVSDNLLMLVMGVLASVFGTYTINALREEAFQARQLGQYQLTRLLGQGGMGEVYLAEHKLMRRPCAVKVIRPSQVHDPLAMERFAREVHSAAQLSHWNSIEIFDYGQTEDGTFFYVMEYLPGRNLEEVVQLGGPMPPARVLHFLRQICEALAEAQDMGMIHRDIKPSNIFAAYRGGQHDVAKLLDFGLVKNLEPEGPIDLTQAGAITGSPLYLAPEVASGQAADFRTDIYSLGAVAYFLLTGTPPFTGINALQVLAALLRDPVKRPSLRRPDIPADLEQIVMRCLAKSPADRYDNARQLAESLRTCRDYGQWTLEDAAAWWGDRGQGTGVRGKG